MAAVACFNPSSSINNLHLPWTILRKNKYEISIFDGLIKILITKNRCEFTHFHELQ